MPPIGKEMERDLNAQLQREFYAKFLYLAISAWFEDQDLRGFAHWFRTQADEEDGHAMRIYEFLVRRQGRPHIPAVEEPPSSWGSIVEAVRAAYEHEQRVTQNFIDLYEKALERKDYLTAEFLHWFLDEQVEEEEITYELLRKTERVADDPAGLLWLDHELGKREGEE